MRVSYLRSLPVSAIAIGAISFATAVSACPSIDRAGESYFHSGDDLVQMQHYELRAGGSQRIDRCAVQLSTGRGSGYVRSTPNVTLEFDAMQGHSLQVSLDSRCDTVLLIHDGTAWHYDDDSHGNLDAGLILSGITTGPVRIWAGSQDAMYCRAVLSLQRVPQAGQ